jgi:hypothetical protein
MAEEFQQKQDPVARREKIARSRELVVRDLSGLRYELDFPLKLRRAFQRHTVLSIGGALALGLVVALLRARTKKVYVTPSGKKAQRSSSNTLLESGLLLGVLKLGVNLLQPVLTNYFKEKLKGPSNRPRPSRP